MPSLLKGSAELMLVQNLQKVRLYASYYLAHTLVTNANFTCGKEAVSLESLNVAAPTLADYTRSATSLPPSCHITGSEDGPVNLEESPENPTLVLPSLDHRTARPTSIQAADHTLADYTTSATTLPPSCHITNFEEGFRELEEIYNTDSRQQLLSSPALDDVTGLCRTRPKSPLVLSSLDYAPPIQRSETLLPYSANQPVRRFTSTATAEENSLEDMFASDIELTDNDVDASRTTELQASKRHNNNSTPRPLKIQKINTISSSETQLNRVEPRQSEASSSFAPPASIQQNDTQAVFDSHRHIPLIGLTTGGLLRMVLRGHEYLAEHDAANIFIQPFLDNFELTEDMREKRLAEIAKEHSPSRREPGTYVTFG
jgi:hypothetical protein